MKRNQWMTGKRTPHYDDKFPYLIKTLVEPYIMACEDTLMVAFEDDGPKIRALGVDGRLYDHYETDFERMVTLEKTKVNEVFSGFLEIRRKAMDKEDNMKLSLFAKGYNIK